MLFRSTAASDTAASDTAATDGQKNTVVLSLMSYEKPILQTDSDKLSFRLGNLGILILSGASLLAVETIPIDDPRLKLAWDHELYRILVQADGTELELHIR